MSDDDAKRAVLDAFERSRGQVLRSLTAMSDGRARVPGMAWNVSQIAAHLVITLQQLSMALQGQPCAYDGTTESHTTPQVGERLLAEFPERGMCELASLFDAESTRFASAVAALDGDHPVPAIATHATAAAICGIFVVDHHNHGMQFAKAGGPAWQLDVGGIRSCLATVAGAVYDRRAAASMRLILALHLRGAAPLGIVANHGPLTVGPLPRAVDCHVVADPAAFLQISGGGFTSQWHALRTGKLYAYGRRLWEVRALNKLLPPVDHGGKLVRRHPRRAPTEVIDIRDRRPVPPSDQPAPVGDDAETQGAP